MKSSTDDIVQVSSLRDAIPHLARRKSIQLNLANEDETAILNAIGKPEIGPIEERDGQLFVLMKPNLHKDRYPQ